MSIFIELCGIHEISQIHELSYLRDDLTVHTFSFFVLFFAVTPSKNERREHTQESLTVNLDARLCLRKSQRYGVNVRGNFPGPQNFTVNGNFRQIEHVN
jgi:hypothetical protein